MKPGRPDVDWFMLTFWSLYSLAFAVVIFLVFKHFHLI